MKQLPSFYSLHVHVSWSLMWSLACSFIVTCAQYAQGLSVWVRLCIYIYMCIRVYVCVSSKTRLFASYRSKITTKMGCAQSMLNVLKYGCSAPTYIRFLLICILRESVNFLLHVTSGVPTTLQIFLVVLIELSKARATFVKEMVSLVPGLIFRVHNAANRWTREKLRPGIHCKGFSAHAPNYSHILP